MNKHVVTALLAVNFAFSSGCMASGVISTYKPKHDLQIGTGWPHIVNEDDEILGLFGGFSTGYNQNAELESTMLLVSSAGYIAPILNNGGITSVSVSYFQDKDCVGQELQPATMAASGFVPYRGMVFHALSVNDLAYIPKKAQSIRMKTQSRLVLGHGGHLECNGSADEIDAYKVVRNQFETTGINVGNNYRFASVVVEGRSSTAAPPSITSDAEE